jgi:hypothetical protein
MGVFKLRKNKKFSYVPRHYEGNGEGSPFEMKHKFDDYRKTIGDSGGIKGKVTRALSELKEEQNRTVNKTILIIAGVLILIFLFIIDFDLSIFFSKK